MSKFLSLNTQDFIKGLVTAVFGAVLTVLYTVTQQPDFNLFSVDWMRVGSNVVNVSVIVMVSYLSKNFFTNGNGEMFKKEHYPQEVSAE